MLSKIPFLEEAAEEAGEGEEVGEELEGCEV